MAEGINHEQLVELITRSATEVFSTMLGLEPVAGASHINHNDPEPRDGVVSLIGLAGDWVGMGSVSCSAELACKLSSSFLMSEYTAVNDEVLDAVAEITNMIIGNVKTGLEEVLGPMGLSIPTVVYGKNFTTRSLGRNEWSVVPFDCEGESMEVQVCLAQKGDGQPARGGIAAPSLARA